MDKKDRRGGLEGPRAARGSDERVLSGASRDSHNVAQFQNKNSPQFGCRLIFFPSFSRVEVRLTISRWPDEPPVTRH